jgi:uncharacterized protein (DUF697 family)
VALFQRERLAFLRRLRPSELKKLSGLRLRDVVALEARRAKRRIATLRQRHPGAGSRELGMHAVEGAKNLASLSGSISGVFGLASVPADFVVMAWLQIRLLTDIATAYGVNLRFDQARSELIDLLGEANGVGPLKRAGPKVLGKVAAVLAERGGFASLGRALPLVAAPVTAWLNNQHIQMVGEAAFRHYDGFARVSARVRAATGADAG